MKTHTTTINVARVQRNPWQTRKNINPEYIDELAADIKANGLLQKPMARLIDRDGKRIDPKPYGGIAAVLLDEPDCLVQLAFGHNRHMAYFQLAAEDESYHQMPVDLADLTNLQMAKFAWAENKKRKDTTPIEDALAIQKYMQDFGWSQREVAEHLGISRSKVANTVRLLGLPEELQDDLQNGVITERQAMAILPVYSLPEDVIAHLEVKDWCYYKVSELIKRARDGRSSNDLRDYVEILIDHNTIDLKWSLDWSAEIDNVQAFTCRACPVRLKHQNKCPDPSCFGLKRDHLFETWLVAASKEYAITVLRDDEMVEHTFYDGPGRGRLARALGGSRSGLRLRIDDNPSKLEQVDAEKYPNIAVVCVQTNCDCFGGQDSEPVTTLESAAREKRQAALKRLKETIIGPAVDMVTQLAEQEPGTFWRFFYAKERYTSFANVKEWDDERLVKKIAEHLVNTALQWNPEYNPSGAVKMLNNNLLAVVGLEPMEWEDEEEKIPA